MPSMPGIHRPKGMETAYARRDGGKASNQMYTRRWNKVRTRFLHEHPLCIMCEAKGRVTAANIVDHRIPHAGNMTLFWDEDNWDALCEHCHNSDKRIIENAARRTVIHR